MRHETITSRALMLAEEFLASSRVELLELANDDLEQLKSSASELRAMAAGSSTGARGAEHVAYVALATAFNDALAKRSGRARVER